MKREYKHPQVVVEGFAPNEYVAACYTLACKVGSYGAPSESYWNAPEKGKVSHSEIGTAGTCGDENANRILTDDNGVIVSIQENNSQQGWINGALDKWIDVNSNGKCDAGDIIYWHTVSGNNDRRWNHYGVAQTADANHPNHS